MIINITEIHESGGGHTSFDFEINPQSSGRQSDIFQQGMQIEKAINQNNVIINPENSSK